MRVQFGWARRALAAAVLVWLSSASAFGQAGQTAPATPPTQTGQPAAPAPAQPPPQPAAPAQTPVARPVQAAPSNLPTRAITVDDAVRLALEQNLGVQIERLNPELQQLAITQARTAWTPVFSTGVTARKQNTPPSSFLSGGEDKITQDSFGGNVQFEQLLPFGTSYVVSYDSSRVTTNNIFSAFNPQRSLSGGRQDSRRR